MFTRIDPPIQFSFVFDKDIHVVKVFDLDVLDDGKTYPKTFSENESCIENWIQDGNKKIEYTNTDRDENPGWWKALDEGWTKWLKKNHE